MVPRHSRPYDENVFFYEREIVMMFGVILFFVVFFVSCLVYYLIFDFLLKKEKYARISELVLLTNKFKLKKDRKHYRSILNGITIINSFIIAITIALVVSIKIDMIFRLLLAFVFMLILIFVMYTIYGKHLSKKWGQK